VKLDLDQLAPFLYMPNLNADLVHYSFQVNVYQNVGQSFNVFLRFNAAELRDEHCFLLESCWRLRKRMKLPSMLKT